MQIATPGSTASTQSRCRVPIAFQLITLILLAFVCYLPVLYARSFIWDDAAVFRSAVLGKAGALRLIWFSPASLPGEEHYWPLTYTVFHLLKLSFGQDVFWYHLTNNLLHCANTILVFLACRLFISRGAWLAAALFAVHPAHVESVAWIIELKDVLSAFFFLSAALTFFWFIQHGKRSAYALSLLLFIAGLLSKSVIITLPVVLCLLLWMKKQHNWRKILLLCLPYLLAGAAFAAADMWLVSKAKSVTWHFTLAQKAILVGRNISFYAREALVPWPLTIVHPKWSLSPGIAANYLPLAIVALWFTGCILLVRRSRIPFAASAAYLVMLSPTLGFVDFSFQQFSYVADRYQYLASIVPLAVMARTMAIRTDLPRRILLNVLTAGLILTWAILSARQANLFTSETALFTQNLTVNPNSETAHTNLGLQAIEQKKLKLAISHLSESVRIHSDASTRYNLAYAYFRAKEPQAAEKHIEESLRAKPQNVAALVLKGIILQQEDQTTQSARLLRKALKLDPTNLLAKKHLRQLQAQGLAD